jgi:hypothetical protein
VLTQNDIAFYAKEETELYAATTGEIQLNCIRYKHRENIRMNPQEELFAKLFNHEKSLVKDMDMLSLRAHREELARIAFEARVRLTAADDEEKERKKSSKAENRGFERNLNIDETSSDAINKIKNRQGKLSKMDKIKEGLIKMGMSEEAADKVISARNIKDTVGGHSDGSNKDGLVTKSENKLIFNPFEKK